jgi:hypothetical protein
MSFSFDGDTYEPSADFARLSFQLAAVLEIMLDGEWWTLSGIHKIITEKMGRKASEAGISARIRDLRKEKFHEELGVKLDVERERVDGTGLYQYRLVFVEDL